MAIDFPTPEQFATSQGARPLLTIITGVVAVILVGALLKRLTFFKLHVRYWQAVFCVLVAIVPWQLHRNVNESYTQVAEEWRSTTLSFPTKVTIAEQLRSEGEWIDQKPLIRQVDRQRLIDALSGCVRSREPAKWFRGRRLRVRLTDPPTSPRELAMTVIAAAPGQRHPDFPEACVTFSALNPGEPEATGSTLEFECPDLVGLLTPPLPDSAGSNPVLDSPQPTP